uniref:Uncharacterized protein n=1 Tax=Myoviridae sp. ctijX18 TaxID=2825154 RepID=A0A8S5USW7_9CAUD|nr:MAG TPA: hypothetical protein [Myoviridae sp. ctijX18]DAQ61246.1 MAG TPA: hypothetical protein [Caudoviricetes sp.]
MVIETYTRAYIINQDLLNQATYNQSEYTYVTFPIEVPNKEGLHLLVTDNLDVYDPLEHNPEVYTECFLKVRQTSGNRDNNGTWASVAVYDIDYSPVESENDVDIEYYDDGGYGYVLGLSDHDFIPEDFELGEEITKPILNAIRNNQVPFFTYINNYVGDVVDDVKRQLGLLTD